MEYASERGLYLRGDDVICNVAQRCTTGRHGISARNIAPVSRPLARPFAADSYCATDSFTTSATQVGHGLGAEDLMPLSPGILHDALCIAPVVLCENDLYNQDWTELDMNHFIHFVIVESDMTCQYWGACGDRIKIKEIKAHLMLKHQVESNSTSYQCFWPGCFSTKPMTQFSSLVRHIQERHGSTYRYWPCPTCEWKYSREETLLKHFNNCLGRSKLH